MEPLAAVLSLLGPRMVFAKFIDGADRWAVRYCNVEDVGFGLVLRGHCQLDVIGMESVRLSRGDFVLMPPNPGFVMSSHRDVRPVEMRPSTGDRTIQHRHGAAEGEANFRLLGGYFRFDPINAPLMISLLPSLIHIRETDSAATRLVGTIKLLSDEALHDRAGRDLIVERLAEVMLVEALRERSAEMTASGQPGLLQGLSDSKLLRAFRAFHANIARHWTVDALADAAGLSRSAFSQRFSLQVGMPPKAYATEWRMAVAKRMLQANDTPFEKIAAAIGYESASAFSTAFRRHTGKSPSLFARTVKQ
jgi:AraC-like DNA-binding protein